MQGDRLVDLGAGAGPVSPQADQLLHVRIGRHHLARPVDRRQIGCLRRPRHGAGDRFEDVDGRIAPALGDGALHDDMAVEDAAHGIRHRLVMVVAVHQHAEDAGDGALLGARPRPFQQTRQFGEYGRRIALGGRRLAGRQPDLALRHGKAGDRIHQHQHIFAEVAEIFRDRQRQIGRLAAHQRRFVRGRDHHHGARETGRAQIVLQEFLHLAAALADQADHRNVGRHVAGQHRQKHRFADTRARKDAHALAAADGEKGIERAHAEIERLAHPHAGMRRRRRIAERVRRRTRRQLTQPVDRLAHGVDHAAKPALGRADGAGGGGDHRPAAAPHAVERGKRHGQRMATGKTHHLARDRRPDAGLDRQPRADRHGVDRPRHLHHQPAHADHAAIDLHAVEVGDLFGQGLHGGVATSAGELPLPLGERVGVRGQVTFDRP